MAGEYVLVRRALWADDVFTLLSPMAQWLYFATLSAPSMELNGVCEWRRKHILKRASALTEEVLDMAELELRERRVMVVDDETEEAFLIRFMHEDGLLKQPNMGVAVHKLYPRIASPKIRGVFVWELQRLQMNEPDLGAFKHDKNGRPPVLMQLLGNNSIDPWGADFDV
ncbi:hypothetical protein [Glutamicibacter ardleyensis]|uniref:Uncharacterized protein n=1 Tax=Glutamicibacter ardleyensis TaxID=225894 RepID=A0ABQ2DIQ2_9MICC|nr:hypothetical protein [Glutamicibacter ardleyensis]GGJ56201.1 hypothetical protein GCM10007173_13750 [Glutamicibacter ardleyensis]